MSAYVVLSTQYQSLGTLMQTAVTPTSDVVAGGFTLVILDSLICISREDQPRCTFCDCALTVVHMLLKCPHYSIVRQRYFSVTTLKDVFEILQAHYQMTPRHLIHTYTLLTTHCQVNGMLCCQFQLTNHQTSRIGLSTVNTADLLSALSFGLIATVRTATRRRTTAS